MGLIADLGPGRIGVDTAVFIYFIEEERDSCRSSSRYSLRWLRASAES
jgi:hypothetical protein